jgi:GT2 family glycosyltransferase
VKQPEISVIIVTHNSEKYIRACLKSLFRASYTNLKVHVIDTASSDDTQKFLSEFPKLRVTASAKNLGFAAANNLALELTKSEFVFLLNPDTIIEKDVFEPLVQTMQGDAGVGACQPLVYLLNDPKVVNLYGKKTHFLGFDWIDGYKAIKIPDQGEITSFSGSGVLLRIAMLREVGAFDSAYFMYYEDSDLAWRMRMHGWKIVFVPDSKMRHDYKYIPADGGLSFSRKVYYNERNRLMTLFKNYSIRTLLAIAPAFCFTELGLLLIGAIQGWLGSMLEAYFSFFAMLPSLMKKRAIVQSSRKYPDKVVAADFESAITFEHFQHPLVRNVANPLLTWYWGLIRHII